MISELSVSAGRVLAHAELLQRVYGSAQSGLTGAVHSGIKYLRRNLGDTDIPAHIFNKPRVGYRMPNGKTAKAEVVYSIRCCSILQQDELAH